MMTTITFFNQLTAMPKRLAMVLTMLLIVGIGQAWGESIEINTTNSGVNGSYRDYEFDVSSITFGCTQWMKNNNIQAKKSITNSLYNVDAIPGTITSIVVKQTGTARAIKIYGGTTNKPTTQITSPTTAAEMTFNFTGKNYTYFSLTTPGNACYFDKITINYTPSGGGGSTTVDPTVTFSSGEYTVGGAALDLSTLWESNSTGAVTYSVTNANGTGATINGTSFTATAAGSCTVQATQAKTASHNAITKTATITVNAAAGGGGDGDCDRWVEVSLSDIQSTDDVVIAMEKSNLIYALTYNSATATSKAPPATLITNDNLKTNSGIANTLRWNISNSNGNLTIYPTGSISTWLYCTNTNNGVRVGTNENKAFAIDNSSGYLKHTGTSRYIGVYFNQDTGNAQDWRCYTSTTSNIAGQTLKFYKYVECIAEPTVFVIPKCGGDGGGTWLVVIEWFATF